MTVTTYDSKSYELAEHFLQDEPHCKADPALFKTCCDELAKEIQTVVEDWIAFGPRRSPK
jgi:hypothetical protein